MLLATTGPRVDLLQLTLLYKNKGGQPFMTHMLALWHRFGTMVQVLSLMETHSDGRSQFRLSEWKKKRYTQLRLNQVMYTCGFDDKKARIRIHELSCKEKHVHVGKLIFGPWYLVLGIWTYGFGPWYLVRSVEPRYWDPSIGSKWFWTMVLSKA